MRELGRMCLLSLDKVMKVSMNSYKVESALLHDSPKASGALEVIIKEV